MGGKIMGIEDEKKSNEWSKERRAQYEKDMEDSIARMKERKKLVGEIEAKLDDLINSHTGLDHDETVDILKEVLELVTVN